MAELKAQGVKILAPPIWTMLALNDNKEIVPSEYAKAAKAAGLDLIGWSLERDGPLHKGGGFYHRSVKSAIDRDGDTLTVLDVLANRSASAACSRTGRRRRRSMRAARG